MSTRRIRWQLAFSGSSEPTTCAPAPSRQRTREWKNQHAKEFMLFTDISADSLVCRPCRHDVTRVLADTAYVPGWQKGSTESASTYCCVHNCTKHTFSQASLCSRDDLQHMKDIEFQSDPIPIPTPLCKSHYHMVYDALQTRRKNCTTCGRHLRTGNDRPCPQPCVIQAYLAEHTDFTGNIASGDRVCLTCYKSHLVLLKEMMI